VNKKLAAWLAGFVASVLSLNTTISHAETMKTEELNAKQQNIVTIAAFTASGDLPKLSEALNEGLDAGLTINEIKEILVQMYAYVGFPRSLNAIGTFMGVLEARELATAPEAEQAELVRIYDRRGLSRDLAEQVATELSQHDLLPIHARDELGIDVNALAKPVQASAVSALSFISGALLPILIMALAPSGARIATTMAATLVGLVGLGSLGARLGGAPQGRAAVRVFIGGTLALFIALGIGQITGSVV